MKYIKTYELFDFLWNKPIANEEEWKAIIDECFYELEDMGFSVYPLHKTIKSGEISIEKIAQHKDRPFMLSEVLPTIETTLSYLGDEYGFKLEEIEFRESKWSYKKNFWTGRTQSGTKKLHKYSKLKYIKGDYEVFYVKLELTRSQSFYPGRNH